MKVDKITYTREELEISGATLLSIEEAESLPLHLLEHDNGWWWLRSPGYTQRCAASVNYDGSVYYGSGFVINDGFYIRPALKLRSSNLHIGDRFTFGGAEFEIVSDNLAFCLGDIGKCAFRRDWKAKNANVYEFSDVKKFIDIWAIQNQEV